MYNSSSSLAAFLAWTPFDALHQCFSCTLLYNTWTITFRRCLYYNWGQRGYHLITGYVQLWDLGIYVLISRQNNQYQSKCYSWSKVKTLQVLRHQITHSFQWLNIIHYNYNILQYVCIITIKSFRCLYNCFRRVII
jgi:hypothetical protein